MQSWEQTGSRMRVYRLSMALFTAIRDVGSATANKESYRLALLFIFSASFSQHNGCMQDHTGQRRVGVLCEYKISRLIMCAKAVLLTFAMRCP